MPIRKHKNAIMVIAAKNNRERVYHVLPFHNFQTGNRAIEKGITKNIIISVKLGKSLAVMPKYIRINNIVTIAVAN